MGGEGSLTNENEVLYTHRVKFQTWLVAVSAVMALGAINILHAQRVPNGVFFAVGAVLIFLPIGLAIQEWRLSRDAFLFYRDRLLWIAGSKQRVIEYVELDFMSFGASVTRTAIFVIKKEAIELYTRDGERIMIRYRHAPGVGRAAPSRLDEIRNLLSSVIAGNLIKMMEAGDTIPLDNGFSMTLAGLRNAEGATINWPMLSFGFLQGRCIVQSSAKVLVKFPMGSQNVFPLLEVARLRGSPEFNF